MPILAILYTYGGGGGVGGVGGGRGDASGHSIHKAKRVGPQSTKGVGPIIQGDGFASEPGGIIEVAMWLCTLLLVGL